jgi:predicted PhzF superfamily epimerase YddE/YHI9
MLRIKQYQVDAFTTRIFGGNPAAVCPLDTWLADSVLQSIAAENNLSETAFFVPTKNGFHLRWFTPVDEVDLCGHAALAAAHVIFEILGYAEQLVAFETRSGILSVGKEASLLVMDFPAAPPRSCVAPDALIAGLGQQPLGVLAAYDYLAVFVKLSELDLRGVVITAPGRNVDFVNRFFGPKLGIPEDPVTGSAHCELAPYWSARLGKLFLNARQVSKRGGDIQCELQGNRVAIAGHAVTFMKAEIFV